ncbi:TraR/DksA family transcriptional regulator [Pseudonocardia sp. GCM10023141]|uniref:TraR/DksA family transcriptional regulator n=1 Tax=Pseudonocardia sp. GCM10023141 TaxID=3252653 RepID=UPI00362159E7
MARPRSVHADRLLAERRLDDQLAALLPTLRQALEDQRGFRIEQLTQIDEEERIGMSSWPPTERGTDPHVAAALREVRAIVTAGAQRALSAIELALSRMATGDYGQCRACGAAIDTGVLAAIPETTLCLACYALTPTPELGGRAAQPSSPMASRPTIARPSVAPTNTADGRREARGMTFAAPH